MFGFHAPELIIVLVVALLIFGPKKLPEMGSAIGKSIKEFQKGMRELGTHKDEESKSSATLEAIDRETASKKASSETKSPTTDGEVDTRSNLEHID